MTARRSRASIGEGVVMIAMPVLDPRGGKTPDDAEIEREVGALINHIVKRARKRPAMSSGIMICALLEAMARAPQPVAARICPECARSPWRGIKCATCLSREI